MFRAFRIGRDGTLTEGPNSPLRLAKGVFPGGRRVPNVWPAGLVSHPRLKILYAQVANLSRTIIYRWNDQARLTFVRAMPNPHSFLPCWTHLNRAGTRMYSGNAGSDNITVFDISRDPTRPREIQAVKLDAPGNPWNFELDPSGHVLFMLDMRAVAQIPRRRGNDLHALRIGAGGRLTEERSSPVKIPVPIGTNPIGLAVVAAARRVALYARSRDDDEVLAPELHAVAALVARRDELCQVVAQLLPASFALQARLLADDVARGPDQEVDRLGAIGEG